MAGRRLPWEEGGGEAISNPTAGGESAARDWARWVPGYCDFFSVRLLPAQLVKQEVG